jgi:hypothetical protein
MIVNRNDVFSSKETGLKIKVSTVQRSSSSKFDLCVVRNLSKNDKPVPSTVRVVLADSIRRRYWKS